MLGFIRWYVARREHYCRITTLAADGRRRAECACGWVSEPRVAADIAELDIGRHRAESILGLS